MPTSTTPDPVIRQLVDAVRTLAIVRTACHDLLNVRRLDE